MKWGLVIKMSICTEQTGCYSRHILHPGAVRHQVWWAGCFELTRARECQDISWWNLCAVLTWLLLPQHMGRTVRATEGLPCRKCLFIVCAAWPELTANRGWLRGIIPKVIPASHGSSALAFPHPRAASRPAPDSPAQARSAFCITPQLPFIPAPQEPSSLTLVQELLQLLPAFLPTRRHQEKHILWELGSSLWSLFQSRVVSCLPLAVVCSLSLTSRFSECFSICKELLEAPSLQWILQTFVFLWLTLKDWWQINTLRYKYSLSPGADTCPPLSVFSVLSCPLFFVHHPRGTWSLGSVLKYFCYC